ncbi:MAG: chitobiase/beta-hexosaminidase C-terminal domain-containing protein, partial [Candidatus Saccharibacteria bacterium]
MFTGYLSNGKKRVACLIVLALFMNLLIMPCATAMAEESLGSTESAGAASPISETGGATNDSGGDITNPPTDSSGGETVLPPAGSGEGTPSGSDNSVPSDPNAPAQDTQNPGGPTSPSPDAQDNNEQPAASTPPEDNTSNSQDPVPTSESESTTDQIYDVPTTPALIDTVYEVDPDTIVKAPAIPNAPVADKPSGTYLTGTSVTLSAYDVTASIYYTTDGSDPSTSGSEYIGPVSLMNSMTLKACAKIDGASSPVSEYNYVIQPLIFKGWNLSGSGTVTRDNMANFSIKETFATTNVLDAVYCEISMDSSNWYNINVVPIVSDSGLVQDTASGEWYRNVIVNLSSIGDRQYYLRATAFDSNGTILSNVATITKVTAIQNVTNLKVTPNGDNTALVITWTNPTQLFDHVSVQRYINYGEGSSWNTLGTTIGNTWTDTNAAPGESCRYRVIAYDGSGNPAPTPYPEGTGQLGYGPPRLSSLSLYNNGMANANNSAYYYIDAYYKGLNVTSVGFDFSTDGTTWQTLNSTSPFISYWYNQIYYSSYNKTYQAEIALKLTSLPDGQYWIRTTATDSQGGTSQPVAQSFNKDTVISKVTNLTVAPNAGNGALVLTWTNPDDFQKAEVYKYVYYSYSSSGYWSGLDYNVTTNTFMDTNVQTYKTYTYKVVCVDLAGNNDSNSNPPTVTGALNVDPIMFKQWYLSDNNGKMNSNNCSGFSVQATFLALKKINSIDFSYSNDGVTWMSVAPYTSYEYSLGGSTSSNEWYRTIYLNVSGPLGWPDGNYYIRATATDAEGHICSEQRQLIKDATPPANVTDFTVVPNSDNSALVLKWTNPAEGVSVSIKRNGDDYRTMVGSEYTDTNIQKGVSYQYQVIAVDDFGNKAVNAPIVTGTISVGAPLLREMYPPDQYATNYTTLGFSASFTDDKAITSITFAVSSDETNWTPLTTDYDPVRFNSPYYDNSGSWNVSNIVNASYKIRVIAIDVDGRSTTVVRTVYILHQAPPIPSGFSAVVNASGPSVNLSWDSVPGASKYYISRKFANSSYGYSNPSWTIDAPNTSFVDTSVQGGKAYIYSIQVSDRANNYSGYVYINVDVNSGPSLILTNGLDCGVNNSAYTLTGKSDPGATVTVNGNAAAVGADGSFAYSVTLTSSQTTFTVTATKDSASHSVLQKVTLDTANPIYSYMDPYDNTVFRGNRPPIQVCFYDNETSVVRMVLQISPDDGVTWNDVSQINSNYGYMYWNTKTVADGAYKFRTIAY